MDSHRWPGRRLQRRFCASPKENCGCYAGILREDLSGESEDTGRSTLADIENLKKLETTGLEIGTNEEIVSAAGFRGRCNTCSAGDLRSHEGA